MRISTGAVALVLVLAASGCGTPGEVRDAAGKLALSTTRVENQLEYYSAAQLEIDRLRQLNMNQLERRVREAELQGETHSHYWAMAKDKTRLNLMKGVLRGTELAAMQAEELRELDEAQAQLLADTEAAIATRSKELNKVARTLNALSEKEATKDRIKFLIAFVKEAKKAYDAAEEESEGQLAAETEEREQIVQDPATGS